MTQPTTTPRQSYPAEWLVLIPKIEALQTDLKTSEALGKNWSDKDFCEGFTGFSGNTWYQLRAGSYPLPKTVAARSRLTQQLHDLFEHAKGLLRTRDDQAVRDRAKQAATQFIETPEYTAVRSAILAANAKAAYHSEERLVIFVAPTRGGKTYLRSKLQQEGVVTWHVQATPCWESSYMAMLRSLAAALKINQQVRSAEQAETEVLTRLKSQTGVMAVEEMQLLSRRGKALLKTILNETTITILLLITPQYHRHMLRSGGPDLAQLLARSEMTINAGQVTPALVRAFAPKLWTHAKDDSPLLRNIAMEANELGAMSCVARVTRMLKALQTQSGHLPNQADVDAALDAYRRAVPALDANAPVTPLRRKAA